MAALPPTATVLRCPKIAHTYQLAVVRRYVHISTPKKISVPNPVAAAVASTEEAMIQSLRPALKKPLPPLSVLPTSQILRSYLITRATSSPLLLSASFAVLKRMLAPNALLLSPERNPILRWLFKHTFYAQFCAGENKAEVQRTIQHVKDTGYTGVILEYALEVLASDAPGVAPKTTAEEIDIWRRGMLETVAMSAPGDFVALKWSGLGKEALKLLDAGAPPSPPMLAAILEVCDLAVAKDVAVLPGAELEVTNVGLDAWTIDLQRRYNTTPGKALMYTTYQAYLRSTPGRIARDLAVARREGFTLGVKLVRGAYLLSEPKSAVWGSKEETDTAYDGIASAVLSRQYNDVLKPAAGEDKFAEVALMIASHNAVSVDLVRRIRTEQASMGQQRIDCAYAQLQGMADEISCSLVAASKEMRQKETLAKSGVDVPRPFKCATWGSIGQCLNFLYRRALENKDAASRTAETRKAMASELWRRGKASVGME